MSRHHVLLYLASLFDARIKDLVGFLRASRGACLWKGVWSHPAWMTRSVREGYGFEALWRGIRPQGMLPSEERRYAELVQQAHAWRDQADAWRICVPEHAQEASPEALARWKEGISALIKRGSRWVYTGMVHTYRFQQMLRACGRVLFYAGKRSR